MFSGRKNETYNFGKCTINKYYNTEKRKVFSTCLFYVDKQVSESGEFIFDHANITTKFYAYLVGLIQSFDDTILNFPDYEIRLYTNDSMIDIYNTLINDQTMDANLINDPYNPEKTVYEYIYSFVNIMLKEYENVNIHVYNCDIYTNKGLFGTMTRLLPFFEDLDEVHIRDTDSSFGNLADKHIINKWKTLGYDLYSVSTYRPEHIKDYIELNIDKKMRKDARSKLSVICNSIGGKSFLSLVAPNVLAIMANSMFELCDNYKVDDKVCPYGVDEIYVSLICQRYVTFQCLNIPVDINFFVFKKNTYVDYVYTDIVFCDKNRNRLYEYFCYLFGYVTYVNYIVATSEIETTVLSSISHRSMKIISYILFYEIKKCILTNNYDGFLPRVAPIVNWLKRYFNFKINDHVFVYGLAYIMIKHNDQFDFEVNSELDANLEDFFYTSSLKVIYPNPVKYNDYFTLDYDWSILEYNEYPYYNNKSMDIMTNTSHNLTTININNNDYVIRKFYKYNMYLAVDVDEYKFYVINYIFQNVNSKNDLDFKLKIADRIRNKNLNISCLVSAVPSLSVDENLNLPCFDNIVESVNEVRYREICDNNYERGYFNNYFLIYNYIKGRPISNPKILELVTRTPDALYMYVKKVINLIQELHENELTYNYFDETNIIVTPDNDIALTNTNNIILYTDKGNNMINFSKFPGKLQQFEIDMYENLYKIQNGNINIRILSYDEAYDPGFYIFFNESRDNINHNEAQKIALNYNNYKYLDYRYLIKIIIYLFSRLQENLKDPIYNKFKTLLTNLRADLHPLNDMTDEIEHQRYGLIHSVLLKKGIEYIEELFRNF